MRLNNLFTGKMFFSLAGILIVTLILSGCGIGSTDAGNEQEYRLVDTPDGEYRSVAWLTDNLIAFNYSAFEYGSTNVDDWSESLIALHKIGANGWSVTKQLPKPEECRVGFISFLSRLPNGSVGFVYHCTYNAPSATLYSWDFENDALTQIYDYPDPFFATTYTFDPSMSELIQTESTGLSESLFRLDLNQAEELEELFTNYVRVRDPSWSSDGETLAFAGTEIYPDGPSTNFETWQQMEGLLDYPWDIFLLDPNSNKVQLLFSGVVHLHGVKWSPQGTWLAFSGFYERKPGIWVLNVNSGQLIRVWEDDEGYFDWSPDGKQMVIIDQEGILNEQEFQPIIIDVEFPTNEE